MNGPKLGTNPNPDSGRDAVHIAIIPMLATKRLDPGERLANGLVDPFLTVPVEPGQWFWLLLYPNTVTSLRHIWTHPAFEPEEVCRD